MAKPVVAIVGRPNVGKSTLFNKLSGTRLAIVDDKPGVTRDRIYGECEWCGHSFTIVDTGGIEPKSNDIILAQMKRQAELAIDLADVVILVTDLTVGMVAADADVARMLIKAKKPVVLCVNKADGVGELPPEIYEFYNLGVGEPYAISATHGRGTGDLLDAVVSKLPQN
ncbi:MAG: 50S ribosome-binding GTPase, partial [Clostridia bacterium]|nr:50S ribosome-binding GTPase [Clostridia bacterium]